MQVIVLGMGTSLNNVYFCLFYCLQLHSTGQQVICCMSIRITYLCHKVSSLTELHSRNWWWLVYLHWGCHLKLQQYHETMTWGVCLTWNNKGTCFYKVVGMFKLAILWIGMVFTLWCKKLNIVDMLCNAEKIEHLWGSLPRRCKVIVVI